MGIIGNLFKNNLGKSYNLLWVSSLISSFGNQITIVALPLLALYMNGSNFEVGMITFFTFLPNFLFGLQAGAIIDRSNSRAVMIVSQLISGIILTLLCSMALFHILHFTYLYMFAFLLGVCSVFYSLSYSSLLPAIINKSELRKGNSGLEIANGAVQMLGPGFGGMIVQIFSAKLAFLMDAASFFISALFISLIPKTKILLRKSISKNSLWGDVKEGLAFISKEMYLRIILKTYIASVFFIGLYQSISIVYMSKILDLSPGQVGLVVGIGNIGYFACTFLNIRITQKLGLGLTVILSLALYGLGFLVMAIAPANNAAFIFAISSQFIISMGTPLYNINVVTLRQTITPQDKLARVSSVWRVLGRGAAPLGAALGAGLSSFLSLRTVIVVAAIGGILAVLPAVRSKLLRLKNIESIDRNI